MFPLCKRHLIALRFDVAILPATSCFTSCHCDWCDWSTSDGDDSASQGEAQATAGIANHLEKFWDPRMRLAIFTHLEAGGAGLEPLVRQAVEQLKDRGSNR